MKQSFLVMVFAFSVSFSQTPKTVMLHFRPVFNSENLVTGKKYYSGFQKDSVSISVLKFYLTQFKFYKNGKLQFSAKDSDFLIDINHPESLERNISIADNIDFDEIRFYLGVDDVTNNNGVGSGDFDPSKGMYWTWQTGYINLKLEGNSNASTSSDKSFAFHLGGFIAPYQAFQTVSIKTVSQNPKIFVDLNRFFDVINLKETNEVMSPSKNAVLLSEKAALLFRL